MQNIYYAKPEKIVVGMVGLPARGKSYISKKIYRFLNWLGFSTQIFNVGNYRRKLMVGTDREEIDTNTTLTEEFFEDEPNQNSIREELAHKCLDDLINFLNEDINKIGIFDATNTTSLRRQEVAKQLQEKMKDNYQLIWIESICDDESIITKNIQRSKMKDDDFKNKSLEEIETLFKHRIEIYAKRYEPLNVYEGFSFIKTFNVGDHFELHKIYGYLPEKIMTYTINLTISPMRNIYLSRHGESEYNTENRIGGDPKLSSQGKMYAKALPKVLDQLITDPEEKRELIILTSTLHRTIATAKNIRINNKEPIQLKILDEINAGICENMTYKEVLERHPEVAKERLTEKINFRYPSGESYIDLIGRLEPLIYWIERQRNSVFVIGHQAIIRCISGYFFNVNLKELPYLATPLHVIIKYTPDTYTFSEEYISVDLANECILEITKLPRKKISIDLDGSERPERKRKFPTVKSLVGMNNH